MFNYEVRFLYIARMVRLLYIIVHQVRNHASKVGGPNRAKPESRAKPEKEQGRRVWGGGSVSPSPENVWNFELQIVQSGV